MATLPITACEWRVGDFDPMQAHNEVRIVERGQLDGTMRYAVTRLSYNLTRDGEWELEPIPSSRDDAFKRRCRFDGWEDAAFAAEKAARRLP